MGKAQQVEALWNGLRDNSGNPLSGGKVNTYIAGTSTPVSLYTASDKSSNAANPIILDAYGRSQVWADGAYKFVVKTSADVTLYTLDNQLYGYDDGYIVYGSTSGGTANAQTVSVSGSITSYTAGLRVVFIAGNSNTGAATINVNSLGNVSIVKGPASASLSSGDIRSGQMVDLVYESGGGGRFRLMNYPSLNDVQNSSFVWAGTSGGTANAQTLTLTPTVPAYVSGQCFRFIPGNANTGATTINVSAIGTKPLLYMGQACVGGELQTGTLAEVTYDGTSFHLSSHGGGYQTWTPTWSSTSGLTFVGFPTTTNIARYQRHGTVCKIWLDVNGIPGGAAGPDIKFTLPINANSAAGSISIQVSHSVNGAAGCSISSVNTATIYRYDGSNFTNGVATFIRAQGDYQV